MTLSNNGDDGDDDNNTTDTRAAATAFSQCGVCAVCAVVVVAACVCAIVTTKRADNDDDGDDDGRRATGDVAHARGLLANGFINTGAMVATNALNAKRTNTHTHTQTYGHICSRARFASRMCGARVAYSPRAAERCGRCDGGDCGGVDCDDDCDGGGDDDDAFVHKPIALTRT